MASPTTILLRAETKLMEHRSVLSPSVISALIKAGYVVKCERHEQRCFTDEEMAAAGAILVPTNSWPNAPLDHIVVGLKELTPTDTFPLRHTHLHFAHIFKGQPGWRDVLSRFAQGHGTLLDIEFLVDPRNANRLLSPSSFHAGFCGAVLAVQSWARQIMNPDTVPQQEARPYVSEQEAVDETIAILQQSYVKGGKIPTVMITGASGKCGAGAVALCNRLDFPPEKLLQCGRADTSQPDFRQRVLQADILINCIYLSNSVRPFITPSGLESSDRQLSTIADVSCDGEDAKNPIAIYAGHTSFAKPWLKVDTKTSPSLSVISIDHLPSLIPRDASEYCANQLLPYLLKLRDWKTAGEWEMARELFRTKLDKAAELSPSTSPLSLRSPQSSLKLTDSDSASAASSRTSLASTLDEGIDTATNIDPEKHVAFATPIVRNITDETKIEEALEQPAVSAVMPDVLKLGPDDSFDTKVVHAGHRQYDPATGAVSMPIVMSSTYAQATAEHVSGEYVYSRKSNPNRSDFERSVAVLEQAEYGLAFSSGSAAIAQIINLLEPRSNIIAIADVYAGTQRTFTIAAESLQLTTTYVEADDLAKDLGKHVTEATKMIWIESPSNPLLHVVDLDAIASQARRHGVVVVVDNTLASPYVFNPLVYGADITVHSATKHLSGHNDLVVGVLATNSPKLHSRLAFLQNALGSVPSPFDCWLASRGLRTFHLRCKRANINGQAVAEALESSPHVIEVLYPGLSSFPNRWIVVKQHNHNGAGGGIVSFRIKGGFETAERFCKATRYFTLAESFGSVQSLCEVPGPMTHKLLTSEQRAAIGVHDDLIRLSMGVEATEDLVADVLQALDAVCGTK